MAKQHTHVSGNNSRFFKSSTTPQQSTPQNAQMTHQQTLKLSVQSPEKVCAEIIRTLHAVSMEYQIIPIRRSTNYFRKCFQIVILPNFLRWDRTSLDSSILRPWSFFKEVLKSQYLIVNIHGGTDFKFIL